MKQIAIGNQVYIIDKYFKIYFKNELKEHDLNSTEGMVLLMLYYQENIKAARKDSKDICGSTQEEIISQLHYDKAAMTRTMQSLEKKLYLQRLPNPRDNRSYLFNLTRKGLDFKPLLIDILRKWNESLLEGLSEEETTIASKILDTMSDNALRITNRRNE